MCVRAFLRVLGQRGIAAPTRTRPGAGWANGAHNQALACCCRFAVGNENHPLQNTQTMRQRVPASGGIRDPWGLVWAGLASQGTLNHPELGCGGAGACFLTKPVISRLRLRGGPLYHPSVYRFPLIRPSRTRLCTICFAARPSMPPCIPLCLPKHI